MPHALSEILEAAIPDTVSGGEDLGFEDLAGSFLRCSDAFVPTLSMCAEAERVVMDPKELYGHRVVESFVGFEEGVRRQRKERRKQMVKEMRMSPSRLSFGSDKGAERKKGRCVSCGKGRANHRKPEKSSIKIDDCRDSSKASSPAVPSKGPPTIRISHVILIIFVVLVLFLLCTWFHVTASWPLPFLGLDIDYAAAPIADFIEKTMFKTLIRFDFERYMRMHDGYSYNINAGHHQGNIPFPSQPVHRHY